MAATWLQRKQFEAYLSATGKSVQSLLGHKVQNVNPRDFQILAFHLENEYPKSLALTEKLDKLILRHGSKEGFSISVDLFGERKSIMFKWVWK